MKTDTNTNRDTGTHTDTDAGTDTDADTDADTDKDNFVASCCNTATVGICEVDYKVLEL